MRRRPPPSYRSDPNSRGQPRGTRYIAEARESRLRTSRALKTRSSAGVEHQILRISKRLLSSRTFPRNVPVHSLPAHPTRPCPRSTHPAFRCVPPPSLRGQLREPGPCCLTHTTQGTRPARPIRLICAPIAPSPCCVARGARRTRTQALYPAPP